MVDFTPQHDEIKIICKIYDDWVGHYGEGSQRSVNFPTFATFSISASSSTTSSDTTYTSLPVSHLVRIKQEPIEERIFGVSSFGVTHG